MKRKRDAALVGPALLRTWPLPSAGDSDSKEDRGRVLVVGGSTQIPGGVSLAATAALRAGAGKLQVATVASVAPIVAAALPEALVRGLPETGGTIGADAVLAVRDLAAGAGAVLIGPGMADNPCEPDLTTRRFTGATNG